jgi:hypothetical protein
MGDLYLAKAELEKAKKELDAADAELQRLIAEMRELREKGQRVPRAEAKARFSELINRHRLIGERFLAMARALGHWPAELMLKDRQRSIARSSSGDTPVSGYTETPTENAA